MMYIRTKEGVYEVKVNKYHELVYCKNNQIVLSCNIIKQSENLAELCDEFVIEYVASDVLVQVRYAEFQWAEEEFESDKKETLYGAIRVAGKGLIYVAKMNESGDLELI